MLYKPGSRRGASIFKGTKLAHYWSAERGLETGDDEGFYDAEIVAVPQAETEGDPLGIYFTICCKHPTLPLSNFNYAPMLCSFVDIECG